MKQSGFLWTGLTVASAFCFIALHLISNGDAAAVEIDRDRKFHSSSSYLNAEKEERGSWPAEKDEHLELVTDPQTEEPETAHKSRTYSTWQGSRDDFNGNVSGRTRGKRATWTRNAVASNLRNSASFRNSANTLRQSRSRSLPPSRSSLISAVSPWSSSRGATRSGSVGSLLSVTSKSRLTSTSKGTRNFGASSSNQPRPQPGIKPRPQPGIKPRPQPGIKPRPQPGIQPRPQPGIKPRPQPGIQPRPQPGIQPRPQPGIQPRPQPGIKPRPQPGIKPRPQPGIQPRPQPRIQPRPQINSYTNTNGKPGSDRNRPPLSSPQTLSPTPKSPSAPLSRTQNKNGAIESKSIKNKAIGPPCPRRFKRGDPSGSKRQCSFDSEAGRVKTPKVEDKSGKTTGDPTIGRVRHETGSSFSFTHGGKTENFAYNTRTQDNVPTSTMIGYGKTGSGGSVVNQKTVAAALRNLHIKQDVYGTKNVVLEHQLNGKIGGQGDVKNVFPGPKSTNTKTSKHFEDPVKNAMTTVQKEVKNPTGVIQLTTKLRVQPPSGGGTTPFVDVARFSVKPLKGTGTSAEQKILNQKLVTDLKGKTFTKIENGQKVTKNVYNQRKDGRMEIQLTNSHPTEILDKGDPRYIHTGSTATVNNSGQSSSGHLSPSNPGSNTPVHPSTSNSNSRPRPRPRPRPIPGTQSD